MGRFTLYLCSGIDLFETDEDEVFDSDFQSTDEEAEADPGPAAEKEIETEEKQARKVELSNRIM